MGILPTSRQTPNPRGAPICSPWTVRENHSPNIPTGENPGIYTVDVPFLALFWDRVPRDAAAAGHADMVMYCLESSRQYPEWEYKDSIMLAAASEQRWHVIDALNKGGLSWPESGPEQASVAAEGVPLTIQEAMDKF